MARALLPPDIGGTLGKEDNKWENIYVDKINGIETENYITNTNIASNETAGLIKVGDNLNITVDGKLNAEPSFVLPVITTNI